MTLRNSGCAATMNTIDEHARGDDSHCGQPESSALMKRVLFGIVCIVAIAWIYLLSGAGMTMEKMDMSGGKTMLMPPSWSIGYAAIIFAMWTIMMVAMMLPTAAPAILRLASFAAKHPAAMGGGSAAVFFTAGYLMVWTGFSALATLTQWALDSAHLLSATMAIRSEVAAGLMVGAAGLYQLSAVKLSCLRRCCSSVTFLTDEQGRSPSAIVRQGMGYGISCLGCCWALMCLLFVVGVMNILWIAAIALWVLAEKTLPWRSHIARLAGVGLLGWGSIALVIAMY
jgi:predicted metal-binding membrane protein